MRLRQSLNEVKRLRESEVTHARVAMAAAAGILLQELWHPIFPDIVGPAIIHFQQVPGPFWQLLTAGIAAVEFTRARKGWVEPWIALFKLREGYAPGAPRRLACRVPIGVPSAPARCVTWRWRR